MTSRKSQSGAPVMSISRREDQILIRVAQQSLKGGDTADLCRLFSPELDWEYLMEKAHHHCLVPLLNNQIKSVDSITFDRQFLAQLHNASVESTRVNLLLTAELLKAMDALAAEGIPAISFKGPTLASIAYSDAALRQFTDIDILIRPNDLARVKPLLGSQGFRPVFKLTTGQERALLRFDCAQNFEKENGAVLDVHWCFFERYWHLNFKPEHVWARLIPTKVVGKEVLTLSPEDLLLVLCVHGFTHSWERLGWICDVAGLVTRQEIDWQTLAQRAASSGTQRILSLGLLLANEIIGAELPTGVLTRASREGVVRSCAAAIRANLFGDQSPMGITEGLTFQVHMRERWRDKVGVWFGFVAAPRSYDCTYTSLPASLPYLYYLARPIRIASRYSSRLFRRSPRTSEA